MPSNERSTVMVLPDFLFDGQMIECHTRRPGRPVTWTNRAGVDGAT